MKIRSLWLLMPLLLMGLAAVPAPALAACPLVPTINLAADGNGNGCQLTAPMSSTGTDASSGTPSLSGLNLLGTLAANPVRLGYIVQVQDTAANCGAGGDANGLLVAFDDGNGNNLTVLIAGYAASKGGQGGAFSMGGMPHAGRIRFYGTNGCQVGAHQW